MPEQNQFLSVNRILCTIFAVWPLRFDSSSQISVWLYKIYSTAIRCFFVLFVTTQWIETYHIPKSNVQELVDNVSVALDYSVGVAQLFLCLGDRAGKLVRQIVNVEKELKKTTRKQYLEIYNTYMRKNHFITKSFFGLGMFTVSLFFVAPFIEEYTFKHFNNATEKYVRPLPFSSWLPFDKQEHYALVFAFHVLAGIISCDIVTSTDSLFYGLTIFCIGQIKILQESLRAFGPQFGVDGIKDEEGTFRELKMCIKRHNKIIEYV